MRSYIKSITLMAAGLFFALAGIMAFAAAPTITNPPAGQTVLEGGNATFTVGASGTAPLFYQWQRNGFPIGGATSNAYSLTAVSQTDNGALFSVVVSNAAGTASSSGALLRVDPGLVSSQTLRLLTVSNFWRYNQSNINLSTNWIGPAYADAGWPQGRGVFEARNPPRATLTNGEPVRTQMILTNAAGTNITTYYFRTHFTNNVTNAFSVILQPTFLVDDGAALYLDGAEIFRLGLAPGAEFSMLANRSVNEANYEGPFNITNAPLAAGDHVIAAEMHQGSFTSIDSTFGLILDATYLFRVPDTNPPAVSALLPAAGSTVSSLGAVEVLFSKEVEGVDAADLRVNGVGATTLTIVTPQQYRWEFPLVTNGTVNFTWASSHGIRDVTTQTNAFITTNWSITVNATSQPPRVVISEFMASNQDTLRDEDGDYSDWIELYNDESTSVNLYGWSLTDTTNNYAKWRFPSVSIPAKGYLLVFASSKNRTNAAGQLHANFALSQGGEFLGLSTPWGALVSAFAPTFPAQLDDVSYGRDRLDPNLVGFYTTPTPGTSNSVSGAGFAPAVVFSHDGGTFTNAFQLTLSAPGLSNAIIRYLIVTNAFNTGTTNIPTTNSTLYTGPITVNRTMMIRARAFVTNSTLFPGPPRSEGYIQLDAGMATFDSDLPVVVIHTLGSTAIPSGAPLPDQIVLFGLFEPRFGISTLLHPPSILQRAAINIRGKSTAGLTKASYAVELQDEYGADDSHELLGMPSESDWVLYAPNLFDLTMMANPLAYNLGRGLGYYAPRTRFVELLLTTNGTPLALSNGFASPDYRGLYVLEERIKRDADRLDIDKLAPEQTNGPAITGGYLFKVDLPDTNENAFTFAALPANWNGWSHQQFVYQEPPGPEMVTAARSAQAQYLSNYLNSFTLALNAPNWTNRVTGWAPYVNWNSAVDYHLLNTVLFNCDSLRWSSYFHKPRNAPLTFGPIWDFDRSMGANRTNDSSVFEHRPFNPRRFIASEAETGLTNNAGNGGTDMFNADYKFGNMWYGRMFQDIDFFQAWIDRYQELRTTLFSTNEIFAAIDDFANQVRRAQTREVQRWISGNSDTRPRSGLLTIDDYSHSFPGTYQGEVDFLKTWFTDRLRFMDTNFLARPGIIGAAGQITNGFQITLTNLSGKPGTTLYYTLDGTDPRAPYGGIAAGATAYTGPITLASNALVTVRARNPSHSNLTGLPGKPPLNSIWSGPAKAVYYTALPPLRITEILYHPAEPPAGNTNDADNFEYLEFKNISAAPLNLNGFRLTNGVTFTFPNLILPADGTCVAVADVALFQSRYGTGPLIAGQYTNRLDNAGERLVLVGPRGEPIHDFEYDDAWYPATDGGGFSLVIVDANATNTSWGLKSSWRPSGALNGSPGANEGSAPNLAPILVTEALTHTDLPQVDGVELYNPTGTNVDLGGWFLTDAFGTPKKYRIPNGTIIGPGARLVFYEDTSFGTGPSGFLISALGDDIWLFSGDANTNLTGYAHGFSFGAQQNGATFGRHVDSLGREHFVTEKASSLGSTNLGPLIGPVVISEFSYHPPDIPFGFQLFDNVREEFVQLSNLSGQPVPLFDPLAPTNTWQLDGGVHFTFPTNFTLAASQSVIIVGFNPATETAALAAFRTNYPASTNATLLGPWDGKLNNDEDTIRLERPDPPNLDGFVPYLLVERVRYQDRAPWPTNVDGTTLTLHRTPPNSFADDPASWVAAAATPGVPVTNVNTAPVAFNQSVTNAEDTVFAITLTGSDSDGPVMNFVVVTNPAHGTLTGTPPNLTYTPTTNYFGADSFIFRIHDGSLTSAVATISITLTAVNDAPLALSQSLTNFEDTAFPITLAGSDVDGPVTNFVIVTNPANGILSGTPPNLTFTPAANYFGPDSFAFRVNDGALTSAVATVSITLNAVNDPPLAAPDALTRPASQRVTATVAALLANDSDVDGGAPNLLSVTNALPVGATVNLSSNSVTYWPPFGITNAGSFNYVITDGNGAFATGLVSVAVEPDPAIPDILAITVNGASVQVVLTGIPGFIYTLQRATAFADWQNLAVTNANGLGEVSILDATGGSTNRWYRTVRGMAP